MTKVCNYRFTTYEYRQRWYHCNCPILLKFYNLATAMPIYANRCRKCSFKEK